MRTRSLIAIALALQLVGCEPREPIVTGNITVNGQPLQRGYVTFYPADDLQSVRGADVIDGTYQVRQMSPGIRRAVVTETPIVEVVRRDGVAPVLKTVPSVQPISMSVEGNNQTVEIRPGKQLVDFALNTMPREKK